MKNHYANSRGTLNRALVVLTLSFLCVSTTFAFSGGDGSPENPYQVATAAHLDAVRNHLDAHFVQTADIDLGVAPWNEGLGWEAIGAVSFDIYNGYDTNGAFNGHYDGVGHRISNLSILGNYSYPNLNGLFAYLGENAVVKNITLINVDLSGMSPIGGIVAYNDGEIRSVKVQGAMEGAQSNTGGIVGVNMGVITQTSSDVTIRGNTNLGGIAGLNGPDAEISDSYSRGNIAQGGNFLGGLVGNNRGNLLRSYTTGSVAEADVYFEGKLAGDNSGTITSCYYDTSVYAPGEEVEESGRSTAEMTYPHAVNTYDGWDFVGTWIADVDGSHNDGYPYLLAESSGTTSFTLSYLFGEGGSLTGSTTQTVEAGQSGSEVTAVADSGAVFDHWSDGVLTASRTDADVQANLEVTAFFRSTGGVDIDWYAGHGIEPGAGQSWADLDSTDWQGKGMSLLEEFHAGTDPTDLQSRFAATPPAAEGKGFEIHFQPSLPERRYTLFRSTDLSEWLPVPGMQNVPGGNGPMVDADPPEGAAFYRIEVLLP